MDHQAIDDIATRERIAFQQRQSKQFLECALNLFLVDHPAELAIKRLRELAQHVEDHS